MADWTFLIPALSGGLAGSILTFSGQWLLTWKRRPRLVLMFNEESPGMLVDIPALRQIEGAAAVTGKQRRLRCRISNRGTSTAQNVTCCVVSVGLSSPGIGKSVFAEETFELKLSGTERETKFNLPAGSHRFLDLVHAETFDGSNEFFFDFVNSSQWLTTFARPGNYSLSLFVCADNAYPIKGKLNFKWDGTLLS